MNDYGGMVRQLMMAATPVGDVVPFIKKGLGPNPMNLTEGAGRVQGGGSGPFRGARTEEMRRSGMTEDQIKAYWINQINTKLDRLPPPESQD